MLVMEQCLIEKNSMKEEDVYRESIRCGSGRSTMEEADRKCSDVKVENSCPPKNTMIRLQRLREIRMGAAVKGREGNGRRAGGGGIYI